MLRLEVISSEVSFMKEWTITAEGPGININL